MLQNFSSFLPLKASSTIRSVPILELTLLGRLLTFLHLVREILQFLCPLLHVADLPQLLLNGLKLSDPIIELDLLVVYAAEVFEDVIAAGQGTAAHVSTGAELVSVKCVAVNLHVHADLPGGGDVPAEQ